jgi:hypothetical protein
MHRALTVPQALHLLCLEIRSSRGCELGKNASRDLAVLARTCTLISKPALNVLWQFQDTIIPLLDCMPPTIWQQDRVSSPGKSLTDQYLNFRSSPCVVRSFQVTGNALGRICTASDFSLSQTRRFLPESMFPASSRFCVFLSRHNTFSPISVAYVGFLIRFPRFPWYPSSLHRVLK